MNFFPQSSFDYLRMFPKNNFLTGETFFHNINGGRVFVNQITIPPKLQSGFSKRPAAGKKSMTTESSLL